MSKVLREREFGSVMTIKVHDDQLTSIELKDKDNYIFLVTDTQPLRDFLNGDNPETEPYLMDVTIT